MTKMKKYLPGFAILSGLAILLLTASFVFKIINDKRVSRVQRIAEIYAEKIEIYKKANGKYPEGLVGVVTKARIEKRDGSYFAIFKVLGKEESIRYDRVSDNEYELIINDTGGISVFSSKSQKWVWHD